MFDAESCIPRFPGTLRFHVGANDGGVLSPSQAIPVVGGANGLFLSVRDVISWAGFVTASVAQDTRTPCRVHKGEPTTLRPWEAFAHGAALVLLDGLGLGSGLSAESVSRLKEECVRKLSDQVCIEVDLGEASNTVRLFTKICEVRR